MIRVAIVGFGNIGKSVLDCLLSSSDFEVAGIVESRQVEGIDVPVVSNIDGLEKVHVAILCTPSRIVPELASSLLAKGIRTVDAYDIHTGIYDLHEQLDVIAKEHNTASIISAGWDPGTDSIVRALLEAMTPTGITYTDFGPGMSMGHTVAVKSIAGVQNALSMTIPLGTGIHRRMVYIELAEGADFAIVSKAIKEDDYFVHDETHVIQVDDVNALIDKGHGVSISRKGGSGTTQNQRIQFSMTIDNPALTAQVLVSCARAVVKQQPGCYTLIEFPLIDMLPGQKEDLIRRII